MLHKTYPRRSGYTEASRVSELVGEGPIAATEQPELVALYRNVKSLSDADRKTIEAIMRTLKEVKKS
jgi:hypothetical protein